MDGLGEEAEATISAKLKIFGIPVTVTECPGTMRDNKSVSPELQGFPRFANPTRTLILNVLAIA